MDIGTTMTVGTEGAVNAEGALLTVPLEVQRIRARTGTVRGTSNRIGATAGTGSRTAVTVTTATLRQIREPDDRRPQPTGRDRR